MTSIPTVIAISGLSLSGKGFLAQQLKATLHGAGHIFEMGQEFRNLQERPGDPNFPHAVHEFVRVGMPRGDIATLEEYEPVLLAAWKRHLPHLQKVLVSIYDGVVRTIDQWPLFRRKVEELHHASPHRVGVIWIERPDAKCLDNWRHRKGSGSTRADDHAGEDVQKRRLRLAREAWRPLDEHLSSGESSAGYLRLDVGTGKLEDRFGEVLEWVRGLPVINPTSATAPGHEFLRAAQLAAA